MKIYLPHNVYDGALNRIRYLYSEFPNVYVCFSGGKDSTVCLELALIVAREQNRLPVNLFFIDQEAEWDVVISYMRRAMNRDEVNPVWLQMPIRLTNATSTLEHWLYCWEDGKESEWIRPKEPNSVHENVYGEDRFAKLYEAYQTHHHPNEPVAMIGGVRCQESPARSLALTASRTYKHITWGKVSHKKSSHYAFYPLYDWGISDVWKAIYDGEWDYCGLYDLLYQHGIPLRDMRVSNVHHETAIRNLYFLQEIEPKAWNRITARISGINSAGQLQSAFTKPPKELPSMFEDWREYRDHLLENIITDETIREKMRRQFRQFDNRFVESVQDKLCRTEIACILSTDWYLSKLSSFDSAHNHLKKNVGVRGSADGERFRARRERNT